MTKKPKILFVPAYYNNSDQNWVEFFLAHSRKKLSDLNIDYTESTPLNDLDNIETIKTQSRKENFDVVVLYLVTWIDPNVAVDLITKLKEYPVIVWCSDYRVIEGKRQQTGAFAALLPIKGSFEKIGINSAYIYENSDRADTNLQLLNMFSAASAISSLKTSRIAMVGHTALGIYPGMIDPLLIKSLFGTEILQLDNYTLIETCKNILKEENIDKGLETFFKDFTFTSPISDEQKRLCVAMTKAIRYLISKYKLSAISMKCCYELAIDFGFAPCVPLSILSDECVTSCECDIPVTLTQLIMHYITQKPSTYVDMLIMEDHRICCACCGFGSFEYAAENPACIGCSKTGQNENELTFNRVINSSHYESGVYTLARLNFPNGQKPCLQVILGQHNKDSEPFYEFGCQEYQSLALNIKTSTSEIIEKIGSQHFSVMQGNIIDQLKYFCKFMNIEMTNFF